MLRLALVTTERMCSRATQVKPTNKSGKAKKAESLDLSPPTYANSELVEAVKDFERRGGKGRWFTSMAMNTLCRAAMTKDPQCDGRPSAFYFVTRIPKNSDAKAAFYLLRTESSRAQLQKAVDAGLPLFLAVLPDGFARAAVLSDGSALGKDTIPLAHSKSRAAMMLQLDNDNGTFAHEYRHWLDYDAKIDTRFEAEAKAIVGNALSDDDLEWLTRFCLELRGHQAAQIDERIDGLLGRPRIQGRNGGSVSDGRPNTSIQVEAANAFRGMYHDLILRVTHDLHDKDPAKLAKLLALFDRYDLPGSADVVRPIRFRDFSY